MNYCGLWSMFRNSVRQIPVEVKRYCRGNWGAPFIVGFMLLLVVAAVSSSMDLAISADAVAVYAYYAVVIGVVLQLVCFLKYSKKTGDQPNGSG